MSDDPVWAKHYFENSSGKDDETYFIGCQQTTNKNQPFTETELVGKHETK